MDVQDEAQQLSSHVRHRLSLYKRDGGICHICDLPVPWELFSLDHIVPRSFGGCSARDNLATSHLSCNNERKSTLIPPEAGPRYAHAWALHHKVQRRRAKLARRARRAAALDLATPSPHQPEPEPSPGS